MKKVKERWLQDFESGTTNTKEFLAFARAFNRALKKILTDAGCREYKARTGHFELSGFFVAPDGYWRYWSISDVRCFKDARILIRCARDDRDFQGGVNHYVTVDELVQDGPQGVLGRTAAWPA